MVSTDLLLLLQRRITYVATCICADLGLITYRPWVICIDDNDYCIFVAICSQQVYLSKDSEACKLKISQIDGPENQNQIILNGKVTFEAQDKYILMWDERTTRLKW